MKTIEDAAIDYSLTIEIDNYGTNKVEEAFIKGVEFAQKWIDVDDELPTLATFVIVKKHNGLKLGMYYNADKEFMYGPQNQTSQITHWRPIELK